MDNKNKICLNSRDELYRFDISNVVYFEADGNYTNIILSNNLKAVVCMNLMHMQNLIKDILTNKRAEIFCRVGKRYIINISYVFQINILNQKLVLSDGDRFVFYLDISKEALKNLRRLFIEERK